ncbi:biotin operon repressor [Nocardia otitidiscaviarum]|uniref:Biotin operon repressor n=1 Tax=Nocardia otitidiscaviarum TaxID=1823 RepID=A0A379JN53_9NOCA|nr:WYL domain-containing protein [Nocardia otitidiscaviarum]SUD49443.1 biotin operon repressor [Nocardia otitidiscaviarum]
MPKTSARLLALLSLLQARRDWPGDLLADRLDVSVRTVRRDIDRLRELGYPILAIKGPDGGYRLDAGTRLPPLLFDDEQAVALTVALRLAATSGADIAEDAARALATVGQVMPARLRHRIDALPIAAVETTAAQPVPQVGRDVLAALGAAVFTREVLRFDYAPALPAGPAGTAVPATTATQVTPATPMPPATPDPEPAVGAVGLEVPAGSAHSAARAGRDGGEVVTSRPRRVEPHHLVARGGRWYLVAWDLDREDWRVFRVDRIAPRIPTGPRFRPRELPGGDVSAFIAGRFRGSDGAEGWPCVGEVILTGDIAEIVPHVHDGTVTRLAADRCHLTLGSWSWVGVAAAIGRFDADFEVVGPPALAAACARLARRYGAAAR